jgi:hypothetical protein
VVIFPTDESKPEDTRAEGFSLREVY